MVDPGNESDPYRLAEIELSERKVPFIVRRYLPDGSYEDWKASELFTMN
jgi:DNA-directed RNA polymerase I, II, and III subunit RPABC2